MGLLLNSVKTVKKVKRNAPQEVKRQFVLDELKALNVTVSRSGIPVDRLGYDELKEEWVFASILSIDIETPSNKFF